MGCCASAEASPPAPQQQRRRLSVSNVAQPAKGEDEVEPMSSVEEDRGVLASLDKQDILDIIDKEADASPTSPGRRRFSVGTVTDLGKTSFKNKQLKVDGDASEDSVGLGYTCRKGLKPESANQDSYSILHVTNDFRLYGVYDGHGGKGHDISNFVKDNLPKLILTDKRFRTPDMPEGLKANFIKIQSLISSVEPQKAFFAGTTCTVVIQDLVAKTLTMAHVADSTAVLGKWTGPDKKKLEAVQLTIDHKPELPAEKARILAAGGIVKFDGYANHRVYAKHGQYPGLNMSRCLGDLAGHKEAGCSCEPDVSQRPLDPLDHVLLVCSDGVWEFIKPEEAVKIVSVFGPEKAMDAANKLAQEAWDRWIKEEGGQVVDDITVIISYLNLTPAGGPNTV